MAEALFTSVWKKEPGERYVWFGADWNAFQAKLEELGRTGYQLHAATASPGPTAIEWTGVWRRGKRSETCRTGLSWAGLVAAQSELGSGGLHLRTVRSDPAAVAGGRWSGFWSDGAPSWVSPPDEWSAFWAAWLDNHARGRRLAELDTCVIDGKRCWTGLWEEGRGGPQYIWYGASWGEIVAKNGALAAEGYGLDLIQSYDDGGTRRWVAVWGQAAQPASFVSDQTETQFWAEWQTQRGLGRRLAYLHCWHGAAFAPLTRLSRRLRLAIRVVSQPDTAVKEMVDRMREVYEPAGFTVEVASSQPLDLAGTLDIDVGTCSASQLTAQQEMIFSRREGMEAGDVAVYFVRTTLPPFNGCAAHPLGRPGVVVSSYASVWTLAHEIGHVLGLDHIADPRRLMTSLGTANIVDAPPDLTADEIGRMAASPVVLAVA